MEKIHIYTLSHPISNEIRYVGQTKHNLEQRLRGHLKSKDKTHRTYWIKSLINNGLKPKIELIETVNKEIGSDSEIFWITMFKSWGFKLCNLTEGGETSTTKHIVRSKEWGENISKGKLKSKFKYDEESKIKMSESAKKRGTNSKGSQLSKLKLTDDDVRNIKDIIKNKGEKTLKLLSKELSLPYTFLLDLNSNRIWKHIH
jgi:hypothetical protein